MDSRLQAIVSRTQEEFGLENYLLGRHSFYKQRDTVQSVYYQLTMEWFPKNLKGLIEEDENPEGTAIIEYNIQSGKFERVIFVHGESDSTITLFKEKTPEEVVSWVEQQTDLVYGVDFTLKRAAEDEYVYETNVDGVQISPSFQIEVKFDREGKLTFYTTYGSPPKMELVAKSAFTLTLEEIEHIVKEHLQLVNFPSESQKKFVPAYAMNEVFVMNDGNRLIPFLEEERSEIKLGTVLEWNVSLKGHLERKYLHVTPSTFKEAFESESFSDPLVLTDDQIAKCKQIILDTMRTEYPADSGIWKLDKLRVLENYIEGFCFLQNENVELFSRKIVILIDRDSMKFVNMMDNEGMLEVFDSFTLAEHATVSHEEAYEKMISYITMDPVYVYDQTTEKYVLCGLPDSEMAVDAVSGEIIALADL